MGGKIKDFFIKHEFRLVLTLGFIIVAAISFEACNLHGQANKAASIVIEKPVTDAKNDLCVVSDATSQTSTKNAETAVTEQNSSADCQFVGSKNSKKVHTATCSWAKRIKPENRVCFKTLEQAVSQGREPDKTWIK